MEERGKDKQREAGKLYGEKHSKQEVLSKNDKSSQHNTRKQIAEELRWSTGKIYYWINGKRVKQWPNIGG